MTCIKTGARVYFENYGFVVSADIFRIADAFVIRWNINSKNYEANMDEVTHQVDKVTDSANWWFREDLGVAVVHTYQVIEF